MGVPSRHVGVLLVGGSAVCWSSAGLFARLAGLDSASLVFWSSLAAGLGLGIIWGALHRRNFLHAMKQIGGAGWLYAATAALNTASYVVALNYTSVANVMTVYASLPFLATAAAFLCLRERVSRRFVVAGSIAMLGVAITAGAAANADDVVGLLAALVMTATFAGQLVIVKRFPGMDIVLVSALSAGISAAVAAPFVAAGPPTVLQAVSSALYGLVPYALGTVLALIGARLIKSGEVGFIAMLDVVLGPIWVWVFFAEEPGAFAAAGCAMVLGAVAWYLSDLSAGVNRRAKAG